MRRASWKWCLATACILAAGCVPGGDDDDSGGSSSSSSSSSSSGSGGSSTDKSSSAAGTSQAGTSQAGTSSTATSSTATSTPPPSSSAGASSSSSAATTSSSLAGSSSSSNGCNNPVCDQVCPHGNRMDNQGCEVCQCKDCGAPEDCAALLPGCVTPQCSADGLCSCACDGEARPYVCPGSAEVPWCACGPAGWTCMEHPEYQCPGVCHPGQTDDLPCADGSTVPWCSCETPQCHPVCQQQGSFSEGWYDSCSGELISYAQCSTCSTVCMYLGTRSEGWYSTCDMDTPIQYAFCAPLQNCNPNAATACPAMQCQDGATQTYACPDGVEQVPFCECRPPARDCQPVCLFAGSPDEGWYDCNGALIIRAPCAGLAAECRNAGSDSEGWYSSDGNRIAWADCATPSWLCEQEPWKQCPLGAPCTGEGATTTGGPNGQCCPGLTPIELALWSPQSCAYADCVCASCTVCGDGLCTPPENPCNCPHDCLAANLPGPLGALCTTSEECQPDLLCLRVGVQPVGVCSRICDPRENAATQCGSTEFACVMIPEHQAPGFCLAACDRDYQCAYGLRCGTAMPGMPGTCADWPECNPVDNIGCTPTTRCRLSGMGEGFCSDSVGELGVGEPCHAGADACGPGLMCTGETCARLCMRGSGCPSLSQECLPLITGNPVGYCGQPG